MSEWLGREYNFEVWSTSTEERKVFRTQVAHAGDRAPDFTLPLLNGGGQLTLSSLRGKPVLVEFGSIT